MIAVMLPGFVQVLSFVGCFCVAMVGFCMPPLLHLRLMLLARKEESNNSATVIRPMHDRTDVVLDTSLLAWGIFATIVSTIYTLHN